MKLKTLVIKNFRSFSPDNTVPIVFRDTTVLVGANNSGKSNVLKAINLVFSGRLKYEVEALTQEDYFNLTLPILFEVVFDEVSRENAEKIGFTKGQQTNILGGKESEKEKGQLLLGIEIPQYNKIDSQNIEIKFKFPLNPNAPESSDSYSTKRKKLAFYIQVPATRSVNSDLRINNWTVFGKIMRGILRNAPQKYSKLQEKLKEIKGDMDTIYAEEKEFLKKNVSKYTDIDDVDFMLGKQHDPVDLAESIQTYINKEYKSNAPDDKDSAPKIIQSSIERMGTGTQSAFLISLLDFYRQQQLNLSQKQIKGVSEVDFIPALNVFTIEEPEIFLHPHGVRTIHHTLISLPLHEEEKINTQVIYSTHFPGLISKLDPLNIVRLAKDASTGATRIYQISEEQQQNIRFSFITSANAELFFADKVILAEGLEAELIKAIYYAVSKKHRLSEHNTSVVKLSGAGNLVTFSQILLNYNVPYCVLLDTDALLEQWSQIENFLSNKDIGKKKIKEVKKLQNELSSSIKNCNIPNSSLKSGKIKELFKNPGSWYEIYCKIRKTILDSEKKDCEVRLRKIAKFWNLLESRELFGSKLEIYFEDQKLQKDHPDVKNKVGELRTKLGEYGVFIHEKGAIESLYTTQAKNLGRGKRRTLSIAEKLEKRPNKIQEYLKNTEIFQDIFDFLHLVD